MAEDNKVFDIKIICPERVFYEGKATMVEFNTVEGQVGILRNHIPLTTVIAPGELVITEENGKKNAALHSGFVEVLGDGITVMAEVIEWPDEIDMARAEEAKKRAEERLSGHSGDVDLARAGYALRKALVRLDIGHK